MQQQQPVYPIQQAQGYPPQGQPGAPPQPTFGGGQPLYPMQDFLQQAATQVMMNGGWQASQQYVNQNVPGLFRLYFFHLFLAYVIFYACRLAAGSTGLGGDITGM